MAEPEDRNLVLDEIVERFRFLTADDDATREAVLARMDVRSTRESTMVQELANRQVLAHPDRFADAHRLLMRAMEVMARHGHQSPALGRFGPFGFLRPIAVWLIRLVARYISYSFLGTLVDSLRDLYTRREAQAVPGSQEQQLLRRARVDIQRLRDGYRANALGLPTFLIGAIAVPLGASVTRLAGGFRGLATAWVVVLTLAVCLVALVASWVILRGAAMETRRQGLVLREPLHALWQTVGNNGNPPRDDAMSFAYVAIVLTLIGGVLLPVATGFIVWLG